MAKNENSPITNSVFISMTFALNVLVEILHLHSFLKINSQFIHQPILAFAKTHLCILLILKEYKEGLDELLIFLSFISLNSCIMTKFRGR